jgi:hypothetical protein
MFLFIKIMSIVNGLIKKNETNLHLLYTEGSANLYEFFSAPYRTEPYRTATYRLSFWKIAHHLNGISVKNAI